MGSNLGHLTIQGFKVRHMVSTHVLWMVRRGSKRSNETLIMVWTVGAWHRETKGVSGRRDTKQRQRPQQNFPEELSHLDCKIVASETRQTFTQFQKNLQSTHADKPRYGFFACIWNHLDTHASRPFARAIYVVGVHISNAFLACQLFDRCRVHSDN